MLTASLPGRPGAGVPGSLLLGWSPKASPVEQTAPPLLWLSEEGREEGEGEGLPKH